MYEQSLIIMQSDTLLFYLHYMTISLVHTHVLHLICTHSLASVYCCTSTCNNGISYSLCLCIWAGCLAMHTTKLWYFNVVLVTSLPSLLSCKYRPMIQSTFAIFVIDTTNIESDMLHSFAYQYMPHIKVHSCFWSHLGQACILRLVCRSNQTL